MSRWFFILKKYEQLNYFPWFDTNIHHLLLLRIYFIYSIKLILSQSKIIQCTTELYTASHIIANGDPIDIMVTSSVQNNFARSTLRFYFDTFCINIRESFLYTLSTTFCHCWHGNHILNHRKQFFSSLHVAHHGPCLSYRLSFWHDFESGLLVFFELFLK